MTRRKSIRFKLVSNLVLGVLILSISSLCLAPTENAIKTKGSKTEIYRSGDTHSQKVSLMFNVYWGTEEVYQILEILKSHAAQATFFIGGCWADDNVECLKAIYENGHEIGNHGYFHKAHDQLNFTQNQKEIASCNRFLELSLNTRIKLFAPPSGAYNEHTLTAAEALGMKTILWSKDTIDWRDKDASLIYTRATKDISSGDFVLMHPMKDTVAALNDILKYYQSKGLKTVTVSENLQLEG